MIPRAACTSKPTVVMDADAATYGIGTLFAALVLGGASLGFLLGRTTRFGPDGAREEPESTDGLADIVDEYKLVSIYYSFQPRPTCYCSRT